jgi:site-specific recombinase XerC
VDVGRSIDLYLGELRRRARSDETIRSYERVLFAFADRLEDRGPETITLDDCRAFLDAPWGKNTQPRKRRLSKSTIALYVSVLRGYLKFLIKEDVLVEDFTERLERPARPRPEHVDVVSVSSRDVERMFEACEDWQELLCLAVPAYLGARRTALARLRWRQVDLENGTVKFFEKGSKTATKPLPRELHAILRAAHESRELDTSPDAYVIPNRRWTTSKERSSKIIYETVVKIGKRAGVRVHVHALRAAFAVRYLESHQGDAEALKELMGHDRIETTWVYLRRMNRAAAMDRVRDLSWETGQFPPVAAEEASLPDAIRRRLTALRAAQTSATGAGLP